jgi:SRSO17 transposase
MTRHTDATAVLPAVSRVSVLPPTRRKVVHGVRAISPFPLLPFTPDRIRSLETYADRFADLFSRADQTKRFRSYLRGLLDGMERKNVEAIAARFAPEGAGDSGFAQALQHFISHSPWEAGQVIARYRQLVRKTLTDEIGVLVVHDGVIPKKGRHSVGTQRQFARGFGRKLNCQLAVTVGLDGAKGYLPLAVRLYLPGYWLRENRETVEKTVPDGFRSHASKPDIALGILDELTAEGWPVREVTADDSYTSHLGFREGLESRAIRLLEPISGPDAAYGHRAEPALTRAADVFDWMKAGLGLEHFEGRTWTGWHHHAAVVLAAYGYLVLENATSLTPAAR